MKVGIFLADSNGGYPVPAARGGAVPALVEHLVKENNDKQLFDMDIISIYDKKAEKMAKRYPNIHFIWVKPPKIISFFDKLCFDLIRTFFKKKKAVSYKSLFSLLYSIAASSRIIKKQHYDKVVIENNIPMAWAIRLSHYTGEYYYHFHNIPRINAKCKEVFQNATAILCVSRYVAKQIGMKDNPIGPIRKTKTRVLYNCIDTKLFTPLADEKKKQKIREKYGISKEDQVVCFVGRLSEEKGIDKVLEAVKQAQNPKIKVLIVGSYMHNINVKDEYQVKLHHLSESMKDQVIFTGYIDQNEIPTIYQIADVAILPSMWDEPAGLTMVEAMACGTPVITTASGGIPEYMKEHAIVLKRDENLVRNICQEMKHIFEVTDAEKLENSVEYVRENFSTKTYLENFHHAITEGGKQ